MRREVGTDEILALLLEDRRTTPSARMWARAPRLTSRATSSRARMIARPPTMTVGSMAASDIASSTRQRSDALPAGRAVTAAPAG